jgi:3-keto-disaccharide hydrolase
MRAIPVAFLAILSGFSPAQETEKSLLQREPKGWVDLFPGKDLKGWKRVILPPDKELNARNPWKVEGELLLCDGVGIKEMLLYEKEFADGVFHLEWRFRKEGEKKDYNSGAYVRTALDGKLWHQVQIAHQDKPPLLGDLFGDSLVKDKPERVQIRSEGHKRANPPGEWNTYEITAKGKTLSVWINGATTLTWNDCPLPRGHVGMQAEFYFIEFRNIKFKPLP